MRGKTARCTPWRVFQTCCSGQEAPRWKSVCVTALQDFELQRQRSLQRRSEILAAVWPRPKGRECIKEFWYSIGTCHRLSMLYDRWIREQFISSQVWFVCCCFVYCWKPDRLRGATISSRIAGPGELFSSDFRACARSPRWATRCSFGSVKSAAAAMQRLDQRSASELSTKWTAENVIAFCRADRNLSCKSLANYSQSKKHKSKVVRRS